MGSRDAESNTGNDLKLNYAWTRSMNWQRQLLSGHVIKILCINRESNHPISRPSYGPGEEEKEWQGDRQEGFNVIKPSFVLKIHRLKAFITFLAQILGLILYHSVSLCLLIGRWRHLDF